MFGQINPDLPGYPFPDVLYVWVSYSIYTSCKVFHKQTQRDGNLSLSQVFCILCAKCTKKWTQPHQVRPAKDQHSHLSTHLVHFEDNLGIPKLNTCFPPFKKCSRIRYSQPARPLVIQPAVFLSTSLCAITYPQPLVRKPSKIRKRQIDY